MKSGWEELVPLFGLSESTANGALALKHTYLRYLDTYEKDHFLGDDGDETDGFNYDNDETSRHGGGGRGLGRHGAGGGRGAAITTVPLRYNHQQHNIPDELREVNRLSTDVYRKTDYDRLALSLTSPLPNEQDFAINVCTLLSNEGRHTLKLSKCPRLLNLLLAHAGVFNHENLKDYMSELYESQRNYDLMSFWSYVCKDRMVRDLMLRLIKRKAVDRNQNKKPTTSENEKKKRRRERKEERLRRLNNGTENGEVSSDEEDSISVASTSSSTNERTREIGHVKHSDGKTWMQKLGELADNFENPSDGEMDENEGLFAIGRGIGTREITGQRILQIATIVRNLSFEEENAPIMASNPALLRFCLMASVAKWGNLCQTGFDILSNVAGDVALEAYSPDCLTDTLLSTIVRGASSQDRYQVIASLDVICKLCSNPEANETFIEATLADCLDPDEEDEGIRTTFYDRLVAYLSLHDIHLLIGSIECLYSLSCLSESTCNAIIRTQGALDALVSLVTVEAQSYGPKACILMRVVETVPGGGASVQHQQPQSQQQQVIVSGGQSIQVMNPMRVTQQTALTTSGGVVTTRAIAANPIPAGQQVTAATIAGPIPTSVTTPRPTAVNQPQQVIVQQKQPPQQQVVTNSVVQQPQGQLVRVQTPQQQALRPQTPQQQMVRQPQPGTVITSVQQQPAVQQQTVVRQVAPGQQLQQVEFY